MHAKCVLDLFGTGLHFHSFNSAGGKSLVAHRSGCMLEALDAWPSIIDWRRFQSRCACSKAGTFLLKETDNSLSIAVISPSMGRRIV